MTKVPDDDLKRSKHFGVVSCVLKCFKWTLYRCICWLIFEVICDESSVLPVRIVNIMCGRLLVLTYSMVQSPSWEANWFAASQEIPRISRNPKVHYRTHKRPPPVSILGQPNPVHIPTSHFLEIHPNIIHPSTPRSPHWSLALRFPHQNPILPLSSPICDQLPSFTPTQNNRQNYSSIYLNL